MNVPLRQWADRTFTVVALLSAVLIVAALVGILLPMIWKGSTAVVFRGTVEFRRMQLEQFGRGDSTALRAEVTEVARVREHAYEILDKFSAGLDNAELERKVKDLHQEFSKQIRNRDLSSAEERKLIKLSKGLRGSKEDSRSMEVRSGLVGALGAPTNAEALPLLDEVLSHAADEELAGTVATQYFDLARQYKKTLTKVNLARRAEYGKTLVEIRNGLQELLGPRPGQPLPAVPFQQYGATRWDLASRQLDQLLYPETWVDNGAGQLRTKVRLNRQEEFAGTELEELFPYLRDNAQSMLRPQWTFYWQYFTDDNISGHYFGGVGPEIIGTLLLTALAIAVALPLGVIAAAYLVECSSDSPATRLLRMCINTLAGVPSIVFGLFGLAFFVMLFLPGGRILQIGDWSLNWPGFGMKSDKSIIAGALTLALLVLPVIIRASEEAIRTVPRAYKEASLALGASGFRCFVTVTLPAAMPGILTGLILSMSRAAGETAPILVTAAVALGPVPRSLTEPTRTLSYGAYDMATGDKMAMLAPHNQFGMVLTLVGIVLLLNIVAIVLRGRMAKRLRGQ